MLCSRQPLLKEYTHHTFSILTDYYIGESVAQLGGDPIIKCIGKFKQIRYMVFGYGQTDCT